MQIIEANKRANAMFRRLALTFAVVNFGWWLYSDGLVGLVMSLPGTLAAYVVLRSLQRDDLRGNIVLTESGFTIPQYSSTEVPWAAVASIEKYVISAPKATISQLLFKLTEGSAFPGGYPATSEGSPVSRAIYGSGVFFANISGYRLNPEGIYSAFRAAHERWQSGRLPEMSQEQAPASAGRP